LWGGEQAFVCDHLGATLRQHGAQGRAHEVLGLGHQDALARQVDHVGAPENERSKKE
jgi:hypothetical protein